MTGPVQVLVVGFEEPSFSGEVLAELSRLREAGVVRLVDVLLVRRDEDGTFRASPFYTAMGPDYIAIALRAARAADPNAKLYLNDYNTDGAGAKADAMYNLVRTLKAQGVPTRMIVLPRQPHGPNEPKMQMAVMEANLEWLEKYLGEKSPSSSR